MPADVSTDPQDRPIARRTARNRARWTTRPATTVRCTRPCSRAPSNGVFLDRECRSAGSEHEGLVGIEEDEVRRRARAAAGPAAARGSRPVASTWRAAAAAVPISPSCTSRSPAASMVSMPIAPSAASAKGCRLVSTSCGLWSDTTTSIEPFGQRLHHGDAGHPRAAAAATACRRCGRRRCRSRSASAELIDTPQVTGKSVRLGARDDVERCRRRRSWPRGSARRSAARAAGRARA